MQNLKKNETSKIVLTLIDGNKLLASDVETGKSDPVGFVWVGYNENNSPNFLFLIVLDFQWRAQSFVLFA